MAQYGLLPPQSGYGLLGYDEKQARLDAFLSGLGNTSAALLAAGAPSTDPGNFGRNMAQVAPGFAQGFQNSMQNSRNRAFQDMQANMQQQQFAMQQKKQKDEEARLLAQDQAINAAFGVNAPSVQAANGLQGNRGILYAAAKANPSAFFDATIKNAMTPPKPRTANDYVKVKDGNGGFKYVLADKAEGMAGYVTPKSQSLKGVWDNQTGKSTFASDEQIASSNGRFMPIPNGMKVTTDGKGGLTLVSGTMAAGQGGGAGSFGEGMNRSLDDVIKGGLDSLQSLNAMDAAYDPSFSTLVGKGKNFWSAAQDRTGLVDIDPEDRQQLQKYTEWRANALQMASETLNRLSGAAVSPAEAERIQGFIPGADDSPIEFQTKLKRYREQIILSVLRAKHFRNAGGYTGEIWNATTLDGMKKIYNDRGDAIAEAYMQANPEAKAEQVKSAVRQRLTMEYGISI